MQKADTDDLRVRVVRAADADASRLSVAGKFEVSVSSVIRLEPSSSRTAERSQACSFVTGYRTASIASTNLSGMDRNGECDDSSVATFSQGVAASIASWSPGVTT